MLNNGNASKAGAASHAVNIGRGNPGQPLSARSGAGVGMAPNVLLAPTKGATVNTINGLAHKKAVMSKPSSTGGRVASMPKGYKKGA